MTETIISSSVLIAVIILAGRLLKGRISSTVRYSLWLIAAVRLMLPFGLIPSPVSVMNAAEDIIPIPQVVETDESYAEDDEAPLYLPENIPENANKADQGSYSYREILTSMSRFITAVMLMWFVLVNMLYSITLKKNRREYVCTSSIPVYFTADIVTPCIFGLFQPAIYIPERAADDAEALEYIIAHETCHYRNGDLFWTVLRYVLLSIYWFDPFVWAAAVISKRDCECACDEAAIKMLGEEKRFKYGKTIIDLIPLKRTESFGVASTAMASPKEILKERMQLIAAKPVNRRSALLVLTAAVIVTAGATFTSAQELPAIDPPEIIPDADIVPDDGRIAVSVTDRNNMPRELICFPAPDGYEPYIYIDEYETAAEIGNVTADELSRFIENAYFSQADISLGDNSFTVTKWKDGKAFAELIGSVQTTITDGVSKPAGEPAAEVNFSRSNGGFSSRLDITVYDVSGADIAYIRAADMNSLTRIVRDNTIPDERELAAAYGETAYFELCADGNAIRELIYELSGRKTADEAEELSYPPFSSGCFSDSIAERLTVTGKVPDRFVLYNMGMVSFAVPYNGSVNEIGNIFLWQDGGTDLRMGRLTSDSVPSDTEITVGTFCGNDCVLYETEDSMTLIFSDTSGNQYRASAGFADAEGKETAKKILGSIHI